MFLWIIAVLVVGQMYLEYQVVKALHLEELNKRFLLGNLAFSIAMSIGFGMLFPAAGMTIAAAGLLSTILSQPMYLIIDGFNKNVKPTLDKGLTNVQNNKAQILQTLSDLWRVIRIFIIIVTFPFRLLRIAIRTSDQIFQKEQVPVP